MLFYRFTLILSVIFTLPLAAEPSCVKLLTPPRGIPEFTRNEIATARGWLKRLGTRHGYPASIETRADFQNFLLAANKDWWGMGEETRRDWVARFMLLRWREWSTITDSQREMALSLELGKLRPRGKDSVIFLSAQARLTQLSRENSQRVLDDFSKSFPLSASVVSDKALLARTAQMAKSLDLKFTLPYKTETKSGLPYMSPRELQRAGLTPQSNFHSLLLGISATVPFDLTLVRKNIKESMRSLDPAFAAKIGFVVPQFRDLIEMADFFALWEPDALEEMIGQSKLILPRGVDNIPRFARFLESYRAFNLFPDERLYEMLTPLRNRLERYVFTVEDADRFLRLALQHWLLYLAGVDEPALKDALHRWDLPGGAQIVCRRKFLPALRMQSFRVDTRGLLPEAPHRPVRAPLMHTVLQVNSLNSGI